MENSLLHLLPVLLCCTFFAILFLQSGLDKVFNYSENLAYFRSHFEKSPLAPTVALLLPVITAVETAAGLCSAAGVGELLFFQKKYFALAGLFLSSASLLSLFFGQRLAKDYGGAAALVPYFLVAVFGIFLVVR